MSKLSKGWSNMKNIVIVLSLALAGCDTFNPQEISRENVGNIINITVVPTSFNESIKTSVETTKGVFTVRNPFSALRGTTVMLVKYSNGRYSLCVEGRRRCNRVLGM